MRLSVVVNPMNSSSQPELFLIGLGVMIPDHITFQARRAMSRCSQIFSIIQESPRLWLPQEKVGQIEVVNLLKLYAEESLRTENYDRVAGAILKGLDCGHCVAYVTYGNPMAYDRVAQNLVQYAADAGVSFQVVPGISSLDSVLCDLRMDMAPGIQVFEASWMVAYKIEPRVDVPLLLVQVGTFGSFRTHYAKRQDGRSLGSLVQYCSKLYPQSHIVYLVRSSSDENEPAQVRQVALGSLGGVTAEDLSGASLYIPPSQNAIPDGQIVGIMELT
jgi:uncharacterized protein YabN with tetrapyrrole methylase and pyrophosphatase domain